VRGSFSDLSVDFVVDVDASAFVALDEGAHFDGGVGDFDVGRSAFRTFLFRLLGDFIK